jgi:hypothetical protein
MNRAAGLSNCVYAVLLRLYPLEFRQRWAEEMAETFALQVEDAWQERGFAGITRIWYRGLAEVFQVAFPLQVVRPAVVVPVVSIAGNTVIFWSLIWALQNSLALNALGRSLLHKFGG